MTKDNQEASGDVKAVEAEGKSVKAVEKEAPKKKTGKLVVKSPIKEDGKFLEVGSEYKGEHADTLLKSGVLEEA